jgi:hypothetical protein
MIFSSLLSCGDGRDRGGGSNPRSNPCGNGQVDPSEACDGADLAGQSCSALGLGPGGLTCARDCRSFDRSQCGPATTCGNGAVDPNEVCEGANLAGQSCAGLGLGNGTLTCLPNCNGYGTSGCQTITDPPRCGDGQVAGAEVCDGAELQGATCQSLGYLGGTLTCSPDCLSRNTTGCTGSCTPSCGARSCGPDPVCGASCGTCTSGTCNPAGQCEVDAPQAPRIISFTGNVTTFRSGDLVFSAIVTDPDGVDDVIGGQLVDPAGGTYGAFATSAAEGAYSLTLNRAAIHAVSPLNGPPTGVTRTFRAQFFDAAGHAVSADLVINVRCQQDADSFCDGTCQDLTAADNHCGSCNRACSAVLPTDADRDILDGITRQWCIAGTCTFRVYSESVSSCQVLCGSRGASCSPATGVPETHGTAGYYCLNGGSTYFPQSPITGCPDTLPANTTATNGDPCYFNWMECRCGI